jgi:endonuclease III-like uncharacterized protein
MSHGVSHFLLWDHHVKIARFLLLMDFLDSQELTSTSCLREWLVREGSRQHLMELNGVGPKTFDYMCCLVGIDCIAVDRHVRTFVAEAGININEYDLVKSVVSNAADLLGLARRDFDAWIWRTVSSRVSEDMQLSLC